MQEKKNNVQHLIERDFISKFRKLDRIFKTKENPQNPSQIDHNSSRPQIETESVYKTECVP